MTELNTDTRDIELCLQSVSDTAQGGRTPELAGALIDLLWSVSNDRPDLDQLPVSISRSEKCLREAGDKGDVEAQPYDADFIKALKIGMPPCAGFGMGIDRLAMIFSNQHSIKEVIAFPTLKPKNNT